MIEKIEQMWWRTMPVGHGNNQTPPELIRQSGKWTLGTAMIMGEDPDSPKFFLEDVTYKESVGIAENASVLKWIPQWARSAEELKESTRQCRLDRAVELHG